MVRRQVMMSVPISLASVEAVLADIINQSHINRVFVACARPHQESARSRLRWNAALHAFYSFTLAEAGLGGVRAVLVPPRAHPRHVILCSLFAARREGHRLGRAAGRRIAPGGLVDGLVDTKVGAGVRPLCLLGRLNPFAELAEVNVAPFVSVDVIKVGGAGVAQPQIGRPRAPRLTHLLDARVPFLTLEPMVGLDAHDVHPVETHPATVQQLIEHLVPGGIDSQIPDE
mmetsp:Transcript_51457/g.102427  ORF Transcript_51457/g.102427 Transcript_51457/m.102427 type:complete len:229 (-) Transcript_51457:63-749(-)